MTLPLPPIARSRAALGLTAAAALGRFELQVCEQCGKVQYPPRESCERCLSDALRWRAQADTGELLSGTVVHHSHDRYFSERVPWRLALVRLDAGPTVLAHRHERCPPAPCRVRIGARLDKSGQGVLLAFPLDEDFNMTNDPKLCEMTCDPKSHAVLVTDGSTRVGQALARELLEAGASRVWIGFAEVGKQVPGLAELAAHSKVALVPLDVTDARSVTKLGGEIGSEVDILVNTAEAPHSERHPAGAGVDAARAEMELNYFGLLRLSHAFAPAMRLRAASAQGGASAWVNVLSIYALTNYPPQASFSASQAAALSLSQLLRAQMTPAGIRVVNVFAGPLDDERDRSLPPPKLKPAALAKAVVNALQSGIEDCYPGEIAQEWLARWRESPKVLEREMSQTLEVGNHG